MGVLSSARVQAQLLGRLGTRRFFLAAFASSAGTWLAFVALAIDIFDRTQSSAWVGALLAAEIIPTAVLGLTLGSLLDRLPRRSLMVVADLARTCVFAALVFAPSALVIVILVGVAGIATAFFRPAVYAGLPNLVSDDELPAANSLMQTVEGSTSVLAPLLGGVLVAAFGPTTCYLLNALTFLISAELLFRIPARAFQARRAETRGLLRDFLDGVALIRESRAVLTVFVSWSVAALAFAAANASEVAIAKDTLGAGDIGFGLLIGSMGAGVVAGAFTAPILLGFRPFAAVYGAGFVLMGASFVLVASAPPIAVAAFALAAAGFANGWLMTANGLLVQRGAPDELRGRAFTLIISTNFLVLSIGYFFAGALADAHGPQLVWVIAGGILLVASISAVLLARPLSVTPATAARTPTPVPENAW